MADEYREALAEVAAPEALPNLSSKPFDVVAAFDRMPVRGERFRCDIDPLFFTGDRRERYREVTNPGLNRTDNHLQGIQRFKDRLYVSAGDLLEGRPHLFVLKYLPTITRGVGAEFSRVITLDHERDHAGGMQRVGNVLTIAIEGNNIGSVVVFLQLDDPDHPVWIRGARIERREPKASAAGLALVSTPAGPRIVVGVPWVRPGKLFGLLQKPKAFLDLHLSRDADLRNGFLPDVVRIDLATLGLGAPPWQSIALLPQAKPDQVMMIGTRSTTSAPGGKHHADLCRLSFDPAHLAQWPDVRFQPTLVRTRPFHFEPDFGDFAAAAGVDCEPDGELSLFAAAHFRFPDGFRFSVCARPPGAPIV